jgi:hypothetical protein
MLRLTASRDGHRVAVVCANVLKRGALLAVNEVEKGRHVQVLGPNARSLVPHADQLFRVRIAEGFEQHPLHDAEDDRVGADSDGESDEGDCCEERRPRKSSNDPDDLV